MQGYIAKLIREAAIGLAATLSIAGMVWAASVSVPDDGDTLFYCAPIGCPPDAPHLRSPRGIG